jgi:FtsP/CotA-like multicopper oxidase with cupredoxin domain
MIHAPSGDTPAAYQRAYREAQPEPGGMVVRVDLEARESDWEFTSRRPTRAWTFNGQVPGPCIEARVGDVLEVRLTNHLPEPTTLHWHGLRLPAAMDGTDMVQHPIPPGGTFTYRFTLLDAGTFWYHTHSNEPVQLERGLYGAIIVRAADEPLLDRERVFVLSDVTLDADGRGRAPRRSRPTRRSEGNVRLLNGTSEPELMIWGGQVERWRIINAAGARYVRLAIGRRPFRILGTGGGSSRRRWSRETCCSRLANASTSPSDRSSRVSSCLSSRSRTIGESVRGVLSRSRHCVSVRQRLRPPVFATCCVRSRR